MAKRPRANSHDKTIRNVVIVFGAIILILGAIMIWNNRSLSYVGTVDGQRIPTPNFHFMFHEYQEELWWRGMMVTPENEAEVVDEVFERLLNIHLTARWAEDLGISLTAEHREIVDERIESYRAAYAAPDFDLLSAWGFSNASLRRFVEQRVLFDLVYEYITGRYEITEEDMIQAFEEHLAENFFDFSEVFVYYIEVGTQELADNIMTQLVFGADIVELLRDHSIVFEPEMMRTGSDGLITESINIRTTNLDDDTEQLRLVYDADIGTLMGPLELPNGNFAIIEVAEINEFIEDFEEHEIQFREHHEWQSRLLYFHNELLTVRGDIEIRRNSRILS